MTGAEGCPIQAISRCLSPVLMCEMVHSRVRKSLCHFSWPIPVVFLSMHDSNYSLLTIALFKLGHHPVMPAIPRCRALVFHIEMVTFKLLKACLTCSNRWSVFTIIILPANNDFPQPFSFD